MPPEATAQGERAVAFAVAGALTIAFSAIFVRLSHTSPETAAFFRCAYAVPLLGWLAWRERRRVGPLGRREHKLAALAGVAFAADLIFWGHAIEDVGAGLATVLGNLQVVFVAFAAWAFLGERPTARVAAAVPIVLVGSTLISGVLENGAYGANPARGVLWGVLTSIAYAAFLLLLRQSNVGPLRPAGPLFDATLVSAIACLPAGWAIGTLDLVPDARGQLWLATLAISSQVLGWLLISVSLPRLPAALASVLLFIQPVGSVLLGVLILDESPSALQLAGVAVILAGVGVATIPGRRREAPQPVGAPLVETQRTAAVPHRPSR